MDDDEESLFGDLGISEVIVRGPDIKKRQVREAWDLWVSLTERPRRRDPHERFTEAYLSQLNEGYPNDRLIECVRAAAYLEPYGRDPEDIRRVVAVLTNGNKERFARALMETEGAEVFKWQTDELVEALCTVPQLVDALGTTPTDWRGQDQDAAGSVMASMTGEDAEAAARAVKRYLGESHLMPSDLVRYAWVWRSPKEAAGQRKAGAVAKDAYAGGAEESRVMSEMNLDADSQAERLVLKGCPINLVRRFHDLAPDGYWDEVSKMTDDDLDLTNSDAYVILEERYEWHPKSRETPTW